MCAHGQLKLRTLQKGTFDTAHGEFEWVHKVRLCACLSHSKSAQKWTPLAADFFCSHSCAIPARAERVGRLGRSRPTCMAANRFRLFTMKGIVTLNEAMSSQCHMKRNTTCATPFDLFKSYLKFHFYLGEVWDRSFHPQEDLRPTARAHHRASGPTPNLASILH